MDYFVDSVVFEQRKVFNPDGFILGDINSQRGRENYFHSANCVCRRSNGEIIAVRCNCGKGTYHPFIKGEIYWGISISIKIKKNALPFLGDVIYNEIKKKWIEED